MDSAKGVSIELNQYDCYNFPAAPNRCGGERLGEIEKPGTNLFFIVSCILLGIICATLIVSVLCYTGEIEDPGYEQYDAEKMEKDALIMSSSKTH